MNVLSLFDGISCARVALGQKVKTYFASEIDHDAIECSKTNWPLNVHVGSVVDLNAKTCPRAFVDIDLLIGGSPCQDLSSANPKKEGLSGPRSSLFWHYVRIKNELRPKYFIFENVYSMTMEARNVITEALGVEPILINAKLFSAQSRKRLFWTNIPLGPLPEDLGIKLKDIVQSASELEAAKPRILPDEQFTRNEKAIGKDLICVGHVRQSTYSTERIFSSEGKTCTIRCRCREFFQFGPVVRQLTMTEIERLQCLPDGYTSCMKSNTKRMHAIGNGFNVKVIQWLVNQIPE